MGRWKIHISIVALAVISITPAQAQWVRATMSPVPRVFVLLPTDSNLLAGTTAGVFVSTNDGGNWTKENTGLTATGVWGLTFEGDNLFAGAFGGAFISTNDGANWRTIDSGLTDNYILTLATVGSNILAGTISGGYISANQGTRWNALVYGLPSVSVNSFASGGGSIFAGTASGVYVSTLAGEYWSAENTGLTNASVWTVAVSPNGSGGSEVFAGTSNGLFVSTDNGSSWNESDNGITNRYVSAVLPFSNGAGGTYLVAGTNSGNVFISDNGGQSWSALDSGLAKTYVWNFAAHDGLLFAATDSGVWRRPLPQLVTSVPTHERTIPSAYRLEQNFPNPFNPTTIIHYDLPKESFVRLAVYNVLGQEVQVLVSGTQPAGAKSGTFDGRGLASGVYFYKLTSGGFSDVKRMVLLR